MIKVDDLEFFSWILKFNIYNAKKKISKSKIKSF